MGDPSGTDVVLRQSLETARARIKANPWLLLVLALSLALNLWGNRWGQPEQWHPDEITDRTKGMVGRRTVNPGFAFYGGMHYFTLALGAVVPAAVYARVLDPPPEREPDVQAYRTWVDRHTVRVSRAARGISGVMATLVVWIVYALGALLYSRSTGLLAALLLAVCPYFVAVAHFATVDMAANLWYWLGCLLCILLWRRDWPGWYWLAALVAGLAVGTKLDRGVIVIPFLLAHFFRGEGVRPMRLAGCAAIGALAYTLVNPWLIVSPFDFVDGTTRELFFNGLRPPVSRGGAWLDVLRKLGAGMTWPLLAVAAAGCLYAIVGAVSGRRRREAYLLLAMFLPFAFAYASNVLLAWYVPLLLPALVLFAAHGSTSVVSALSGRGRRLALATVAGVAAFALLNSIELTLQFSRESRYLAAEWIQQHVPSGATVELGSRAPWLARERYSIARRPVVFTRTDYFVPVRERLDRDPFYGRVRATILQLEQRFAPSLGIAVRERPYRAWFDYLDASPAPPREGPAVVSSRYRVFVGEGESALIARLRRPDSGYRLVAAFRFRGVLRPTPTFPFLNPEVLIFERIASATERGGTVYNAPYPTRHDDRRESSPR